MKTLIMPKTLGGCVDLIYKIREQRQKVDAESERLRSQENALKNHVLANFNKDDVEGATGKVASASINRKTTAHVTDWQKFYDYIAKKKAWDLLQRRPNDKAFADRLEAKEQVPGAEPFIVVTLNVRKVGGK